MARGKRKRSVFDLRCRLYNGNYRKIYEAESELKKDNIADAMELLGALKEMKKDYPETLKRVSEQKKEFEEERALQEAERGESI